VQLDRNDVLIVYTDGITEASNVQGNFLGTDGLMGILQNVPLDSPAAMADGLRAALQDFRTSAPRDDDQRFFILRQLEG
jgi:phosphoserine phosphatase RsbU/P